jgi:hypothetical protein
MRLARTGPLVDLNFVKTTQAVTDGTGENLLTVGLAAYANKPMGTLRTACVECLPYFACAQDPETLEKRPESAAIERKRAARGSELLRIAGKGWAKRYLRKGWSANPAGQSTGRTILEPWADRIPLKKLSPQAQPLTQKINC